MKKHIIIDKTIRKNGRKYKIQIQREKPNKPN